MSVKHGRWVLFGAAHREIGRRIETRPRDRDWQSRQATVWPRQLVTDQVHSWQDAPTTGTGSMGDTAFDRSNAYTVQPPVNGMI
jgi:hypothetical protein